MREKQVFVVEPYRPRGGSYMAYQVARIVHEDFGFRGVAVGDSRPDNRLFDYPITLETTSFAEMEASISAEDILLANPFFSPRWFGFRCRGRKLMYVQGFTTFAILDCRFDHYVSVSEFVRRFISSTYAIETAVVPPFINTATFPAVPPWRDRPAGSILALINYKGNDYLEEILLRRIREIVVEHSPDLAIEPIPAGGIPHRELLETLAGYRYLLTLSAGEGFGLIPLEAMALGVTVVGFDAFGGRDYMRDGVNCAVASYPDVEGVAHRLAAVLGNSHYAESLAEAGRITGTSAEYTYERFRSDWREQITSFLRKTA